MLSEALRKINAAYLPGAIDFYQALPGDPWSSAHQAMDEELVLAKNQDRGVSIQAVHEFESTLLDLLNRYRPFVGNKTKDLTKVAAEIGFMSNSESESDTRFSLYTRSCAVCTTKKSVQVKKHPVNGVGIYCEPCFSEIDE